MSETRFHGARVTENTDLVTAINDVDSSVIGIVATADDADAKLFPLNKPTLLTRVNDVLGKCGTTGTLYRALKAIADQVSTKVIVVRVAEHKEEDGKTQDQLVIGGSESDGSYTGMYALLVAEQDESIGYRPRILAAPELDVYARLTQAQLRNRLEPEKGVFIAESPKVIARALDAGYQPLSLLMERKQITGPAQDILTRCGDAPVYTADREMLARLTGYELTRGVLCAFRRPAPRTVEQVCRDARRVAVLEGIVDSTNVGAIFRSAAALNMDAVLITPSCCDPLCRRAVRVSMGTVFQVPWAQIGTCPADWPENGSAQLHALGFKTAAMALSDRSVSIDDAALAAEPKLAIVLGTEGDGLANSTIAACDYTVKIPMSHGVDSLNVAAASAVAFWQLGRL